MLHNNEFNQWMQINEPNKKKLLSGVSKLAYKVVKNIAARKPNKVDIPVTPPPR